MRRCIMEKVRENCQREALLSAISLTLPKTLSTELKPEHGARSTVAPVPSGALSFRYDSVRSGRAPLVVVVESADLLDLNEISGSADRAAVGRIRVQREMSAPPVVVGQVVPQDALEVAGIPHEHVIETLAPDRSDHPFHVSVLPRAAVEKL